MNALLALLTLAAVATGAPGDDVHPIEIKPGHESIAWIGGRGEPPIVTVFPVALDERNVPTAQGETPLLGLAPGRYELHVETAGDCWFNAGLVAR